MRIATILSLVGIFLASGALKAEVFVFGQGKYRAETQWERGPFDGNESRLLLQISEISSGRQVDLASAPELVLWMPDMGHGSSPTKLERTGAGPGQYRFAKVYFLMPGRWELRLNVRAPGAEPEVLTWPVDITPGS